MNAINTSIGTVEINQVNNKIEVIYYNLDNELITDFFKINNFDIDSDESISLLEKLIVESDNYIGVLS